MTDINALASIVQGGRALAYSLGNLDQQFRQTYPGYGYNAGAYYAQYRNWSQTSLDTTLGALRAAGLQGQQLQSEQAVFNSLRSYGCKAPTVGCRRSRCSGEISEQQVQQMMKLRELMMADMSSKQAYQAAMIQQQAASEAATSGSSTLRRQHRMANISSRMAEMKDDGGFHADCVHMLSSSVAMSDVRLQAPEPPSAIVQKAASRLALATLADPLRQSAVEDWLRKHRDLAVEVDDMCKPVRESGERMGRYDRRAGMCSSRASCVMQCYDHPETGDGKTYQAGNK